MNNQTEQAHAVLVIDDDPQVQDAINDILDMIDINCLVASNGQEGLMLYQANHKFIDLVLLDLHMPIMNGVETLAELQLFDPDVKVLIASSVSDPEVIEQLLADGALGYLRKPYGMNTLIEAIQTALDNDGSDGGLFVREPAASYVTSALVS